MKISQRELILSVTTLTIVLFGGTLYALDSKLKTFKEQKSDTPVLNENIKNYKAVIKKQTQWKGQLAKLQSTLTVFPEDQQSVAPQLTRTIKTIAAKHGLEITKNNPRTEEQTGDLYQLTIAYTWNGSLEHLIDVLWEIQSKGLRFDTTSLSIKPQGRNQEGLTGTMDINFTYMRKKQN